jgi:hypothetical protein
VIRPALLLACLALAGCAAVSRSASYAPAKPSTVTLADGRTYEVVVHPTDNALLMRRGLLTGMGQAFVRGATFHIAQPGEAYDPWKAAATTFLQPLGCEATDVYPLGIDTGAWEARYRCPDGVDLRRAVSERRNIARPSRSGGDGH